METTVLNMIRYKLGISGDIGPRPFADAAKLRFL